MTGFTASDLDLLLSWLDAHRDIAGVGHSISITQGFGKIPPRIRIIGGPDMPIPDGLERVVTGPAIDVFRQKLPGLNVEWSAVALDDDDINGKDIS